MIPQGASISAQTAIGAHLTHRDRLYLFPNPFLQVAYGDNPMALRHQLGRSLYWPSRTDLHRRIADLNIEYVVLGPADSSIFPMRLPEFQYLADVFAEDEHFGAVFARGDILILKRGANYKTGRELIEKSVKSGELTLVDPLATR